MQHYKSTLSREKAIFLTVSRESYPPLKSSLSQLLTCVSKYGEWFTSTKLKENGHSGVIIYAVNECKDRHLNKSISEKLWEAIARISSHGRLKIKNMLCVHLENTAWKFESWNLYYYIHVRWRRDQELAYVASVSRGFSALEFWMHRFGE